MGKLENGIGNIKRETDNLPLIMSMLCLELRTMTQIAHASLLEVQK